MLAANRLLRPGAAGKAKKGRHPSTAFAATSEKFGKGEWIQDFQPEIERASALGELFRIKGHCQSNCTLFLGLRNACVERSATLLFHSGHDRQRDLMRTPPTGC